MDIRKPHLKEVTGPMHEDIFRFCLETIRHDLHGAWKSFRKVTALQVPGTNRSETAQVEKLFHDLNAFLLHIEKVIREREFGSAEPTRQEIALLEEVGEAVRQANSAKTTPKIADFLDRALRILKERTIPMLIVHSDYKPPKKPEPDRGTSSEDE